MQEAGFLIEALTQEARRKVGGVPIFGTLPDVLPISSAERATYGSSLRFRARVNMLLADGVAQGKWLIWEQATLAGRYGFQFWFDPIQFHAAKIPISIASTPLAADNIAGLLASVRGKAARCIVLDLDNTIWGGVVADDGIEGISLGQNSALGEAFVNFQRFILQLRQRGVVVAICLKNNDETARAPFRGHPEMLLKEDHVAVFQANWASKATNIRAISEKLCLGLETIAYIDDNPAERERVRQELPLVSTIEVGEDPSFFVERILGSGVFEHLPLTRDDLARAQSYGARAAAAEIKSRIGNYEDYLTSLDMELTVAPFDQIGRQRIVQLINRILISLTSQPADTMTQRLLHSKGIPR